MIRWLIATVICSLVFCVGYAQTDDTGSEWSLYLFPTVNGEEVLRIDADGTHHWFDLGLTSSNLLLGDTLAVTMDGRAVYCVHDRPHDDAAPTEYSLRVRDLAAMTTSFDVALGVAYDCDLFDALSPDDGTIAVGVLNYYEQSPAADFSQPVWELPIFDTHSGERIAELHAEMPAVKALIDVPYYSRAPHILSFDGTTVWLELHPASGTDEGDVLVIRWDIFSGEVTVPEQDAVYTMQINRLLTEGQYAVNVSGSIAAIRSGHPMPVTLASVDDSQSLLITAAAYIDDGQRLAVQMLSSEPLPGMGVDPNTMNYSWSTVDSTGTVTPIPDSLSSISQVVGIPGGYALLKWIEARDQAQETLTVTIDGESRDVFTRTAEPYRANWRIVRVVPATLPGPNAPEIVYEATGHQMD